MDRAGARNHCLPRYRNGHARRLNRHGENLSVPSGLPDGDVRQIPRQPPRQLRVRKISALGLGIIVEQAIGGRERVGVKLEQIWRGLFAGVEG